jgi:hypothetical protein
MKDDLWIDCIAAYNVLGKQIKFTVSINGEGEEENGSLGVAVTHP